MSMKTDGGPPIHILGSDGGSLCGISAVDLGMATDEQSKATCSDCLSRVGLRADRTPVTDLDTSAYAIDLAIRTHGGHPAHGWLGVEWDGDQGFAVCRCGARLAVVGAPPAAG